MSWPQDQYTQFQPEQVQGEDIFPVLPGEEPMEQPVECCRPQPLREIPILNITLDCTPVTFHTPGQARNVMSCPETFTTFARCDCTNTVVEQLPNGCCMVTPVTQTFFQPVTCVCNHPPVCRPLPQIICP